MGIPQGIYGHKPLIIVAAIGTVHYPLMVGLNNTKIFEGDILKVSWNVDGREPTIALFVCEYHKSAFLCRRLNSKNIVGTLSNYVSIKKNKNVFISCEVVGNIIDNPEISVCL